MICSLPGCGQPSLVQWQRTGTPDEAARSQADQTSQRQAGADNLRVTLQLQIAAADHAIATVPNTVEGHRMADRWALERDQAVEMLDAVVDPAPVPLDGVRVAVFACHDHAVDLAKAAHVHEAHCLTVDVCACDTTPPAETGIVEPPPVHPVLAGKGWA